MADGVDSFGGDDAWGGFGFSKWFKQYINQYTITMDIKVNDDIPRDGISLFQTDLAYTEENAVSKSKSVKQSEGECTINRYKKTPCTCPATNFKPTLSLYNIQCRWGWFVWHFWRHYKGASKIVLPCLFLGVCLLFD